MANTRDFKSLGIWGVNAGVPPENPSGGTPYRNTALTQEENEAGEPYGDPSISADFNQKMFIVTSLLNTIDTHGTLGWYDQVNYTVPALVYASDSNFYQALRDSGPGNGGAIDPTSDDLTNPAWQFVESSQILRDDLDKKTVSSSGSTLVGYNKVDTNGGVDEGITVKSSLDELYLNQNFLNGLQLVASGYFSAPTPDNPNLSIVSHDGYNIKDNSARWLTENEVRVQLIDTTIDINRTLQFVTMQAVENSQGVLEPIFGTLQPRGLVGGFPTIDIFTRYIDNNTLPRTDFTLMILART